MKRDIGLDFIRIILTMMIVTFHFCEANGLYSSKLFTMANGTWGWVATTSFILLSGYLLRLIHKNIRGAVWAFYKKRLLSLFPSFYVAFVICFIVHSVYLGSPFFGGHPAKILLSILGIDSYVGLYGISTYAVVGEWFTGLIIMLYVLYPVLNLLMNKFKIFTSVILFLFYVCNVLLHFDKTIADASIITGAFIFWCGMLMADYSQQVKSVWYVGILLLIFFAVLSYIPINIPRLFVSNFMGLLLFVAMLKLFSGVKVSDNASKYISYLSVITYEIYLIHHFVMYKVSALLKNVITNTWQYVVSYFVVLIFIVLCAMAVHYIAGQVRKLIAKGEKA